LGDAIAYKSDLDGVLGDAEKGKKKEGNKR
jgi:hypothetical protein